MGWRELMAYVQAMNRAKDGQRASVDSWQGAENDASWIELRRMRDEQLGRF